MSRYTPTEDEKRVIAWLEDRASEVMPQVFRPCPVLSFLWALCHPFRFYEGHGRFRALLEARDAIEQGHHRHD